MNYKRLANIIIELNSLLEELELELSKVNVEKEHLKYLRQARVTTKAARRALFELQRFLYTHFDV